MTPEGIDDVIVHFLRPAHHPIGIGIEVPLDEVVHVDQRDQLPRLRLGCEVRCGVREIRWQLPRKGAQPLLWEPKMTTAVVTM